MSLTLSPLLSPRRRRAAPSRPLRALLAALPLALLGPAGAQAPALDCRTSWIGNSFGGAGHESVPDDMDGLYVALDGLCCTGTGWDEGGHALARFKDGRILGPLGPGDSGGGVACGGGTFLYAARNHGGFRRYTPAGAETGWAALPGHQVLGIAARGGTVWVTDITDNRVHAFAETPDGREVGGFPVPDPARIAVDTGGGLWISHRVGDHGATGTVDCYAPTGRRLRAITLPGRAKVTGLCLDLQGRLVVADDGPDQNIKIYDIRAGRAPRLATTVGVRGGTTAGPVPGLAGPLRFAGLTGVGMDRAGRLYVSQNGYGPEWDNAPHRDVGPGNGKGAILECYTPSGERRWVLYGQEFIDNAALDPASETDVYTPDEHFTLDYSRPPGREATYRAFTINAAKYPQDPRLLYQGDINGVGGEPSRVTAILVRRVQGRKLLYLMTQYGEGVFIYRFNPGTDGEVAIPCGAVWKGHYGQEAYLPGEPKDGEWIWRDTNHDGRMNPSEFSQPPHVAARHVEGRNWWVDDRGDIWDGSAGVIRRFPLEGFDGQGAPRYSYASLQTRPLPAGIGAAGRIAYLVDSDTMYVMDGDLTACHRFDRWSAAPIEHPGYPLSFAGRDIAGFSVAGRYVFVQRGRPHQMDVFDADTGAPSGTLVPGAAVGGPDAVGDTDMPFPTNAHRRSNGEYVIFTEDDYKAKILMYRWKPRPPLAP